MEKRDRARLPRRLTCQIQTPDERVSGFVRNVSRSGFFVQTGAKPRANSLVHVVFPAIGNQPELRIEAGVARRRNVSRRLAPTAPSGIGLEVIPPRGDYERWIFGPAEPSLIGSASTTHYAYDCASPVTETIELDQIVHTFRFRMLKHDRSACRTVMIQSTCEATARARALVRLGAGWKIAETL
ncbi:MAG: PilZ domain-containing protein [Myxococcota bacterium]